ncbi:MAG TPA: L-rhamnose isomerase, partial [Armatimonadota bacterium]|nr:L-rhamnose isomerase [Armatimonadota bacterium]
DKIYWALDFFDASINRIGAWVVGTRTLRKALLNALLEPTKLLAKAEADGKGAEKLALQELRGELPFGAVWDYACLQADTPPAASWLADMYEYEKSVLAER